jgi:hypothetical protein
VSFDVPLAASSALVISRQRDAQEYNRHHPTQQATYNMQQQLAE